MRPLVSTPARLGALTLGALLLAPVAAIAGDKPLELVDLMRLRTIQDPVIAEDGTWIAYSLVPDRGDGRAVVRATGTELEHTIERGSHPRISADGEWVAAFIEPTLEEREKANGKKGAEKPRTGLALLATADGSATTVAEVESFAFSADGAWLAYQRFKEEEKGDEEEAKEEGEEEAEAAGEVEPAGEGEPEAPPEAEPEEEPAATAAAEEEPGAGEGGEEEGKEKKKDERLGSTLVLRRLAGGEEVEIPHVESYAFAERGPYLAYAVAAPAGEGNGVFVRRLDADGAPEEAVRQDERGRYTALTWPEEADLLAFVAAVDDEDGHPDHASVWVWDGRGGRALATSDEAPGGWFIPSANELAWSRDGARLFFGYKPLDEEVPPEEDEEEGDADGEGGEEEAFDPYDVEAILEGREVVVWHGDDPLIQPQQEKRWEEEKKRTYRAVAHLATGRVAALADREMRIVQPSNNPVAALGLADVPYLKTITWDGFYQDAYRVSLADGSRQLVAEHLAAPPSLSPDGRYAVYYRTPHWVLFDGETGEEHNLTAELAVPFADEDHDYPAPAPGYGVADWLEGGEAVLIYDKYDIWRFPTEGGEAECLTAGEGRRTHRVFRLVDLDPERDFVRPGESLLLSAYHDDEKHQGFYAARVGEVGVRQLTEPKKRLTFVAKAEKADRILFTRESYSEFPDLWVAPQDLSRPRKLSDANPEIADYAWGTAELVEWTSADGLPLQGVLIKPGNYRPGQRYPVLVYYYRFFSQRLYEFNEPVVNHRPSFPVYASHGYAVFLPDVRFEVGRPGLGAVKALVPGVQKLVDMGVADPEAIGLHGHSWSGYQTAFVVTQTNLFAAAVAGAPVSNMTSAYSGIRWGSGLARQFQYEKGQSRIGGSLWEARDLYIESSPVFFADRMETPLLIEFGDEDGAVPWYQGIELYLALRRLGKDVVFLQYKGEPHHLKKYANKLDYSIKMRQFFDHHLKGEPAPEWMTEGVPYRGE